MRSVVVVLLLLARIAHADVGVVVSGDPTLQAPAMNHVQHWLQDKAYGLVAAPLGTSTSTFVDCFVIEDMACARKLFDEAKAPAVVFVRVDMLSGRDFTVTAFWFAKGKEPVTDKRPCKQCDDAALGATISSTMDALVGKGGVDPSPPKKVEPAPVPQPVTPKEPEATKSKTVPRALLLAGAAAVVAGSVFLYYGSLRGPDEPYVYTNATEIGLPLALAGTFALGFGFSGSF